MSTTAGYLGSGAPIAFTITHPFHPKHGCQFLLATRKHNWGEDRVMFFDAQGRLRSMLTSWTSLAGEDAFTQVSAGRSWFRIDDLLKLVALLDRCTELHRPRRRYVK